MLLLERSLRNSGIRIGSDVRVNILRISQTRVLVGVEAPRSVPVWRNEIAPEDLPAGKAARDDRPFHILLVEDDPIHARLIGKVVSQYAATRVTHTPSGEEALERLREGGAGRPDLVILDLHLPGMSGLDVLQRIRSTASLKTTPVVILSCSDSAEEATQCLVAGANAFVSKSGDYDDLRGSVFRIADFWRNTRRVA
jgi:carbon storage regulator CsrA